MSAFLIRPVTGVADGTNQDSVESAAIAPRSAHRSTRAIRTTGVGSMVPTVDHTLLRESRLTLRKSLRMQWDAVARRLPVPVALMRPLKTYPPSHRDRISE
jgi:hypothetical protein